MHDSGSTIHRISKARRMARIGAGRAIREAAGISLNEIARELGVNGSVVSRWERGQVMPSARLALAWLAALESLDR